MYRIVNLNKPFKAIICVRTYEAIISVKPETQSDQAYKSDQVFCKHFRLNCVLFGFEEIATFGCFVFDMYRFSNV